MNKGIIISSVLLLLSSAAFAWNAGKVVLTVDDCTRMAMSNNVDVRNAALDVTAARLQKQEALAEYFPTVSAMGLAFHSLSPMIDISMTDIMGTSDMAWQIRNYLEEMAAPYDIKTKYRALQHGYSGVVMLQQPVFAGGRIVTGNNLAALGIRAAEVKNSLQKRQSAEDVRKIFYQTMALQDKKSTLESIRVMLDTLRRDVASAVAAGLAVETDLSALDIKISELRAGISKLETGLRVAKMNLLNNVGMEYNPYSAISSDLPGIDSFVLEGDFSNMVTPSEVYVNEEKLADELDESTLLQMQVDAKVLERRMTLGQTLPSLALGASYGYSKLLTNPKFNGAMYAVLQIPITDWGKNSLKMKRQSIEIQKAQNQRDFYRNQLVLQMRQIYMELGGAYDQMQIALEAEVLALRRFTQMQRSYQAGLCTIGELLRCEQEYSSAGEAYIDASLDYLSALDSYRLRIRR